jgi:hypothetical protein
VLLLDEQQHLMSLHLFLSHYGISRQRFRDLLAACPEVMLQDVAAVLAPRLEFFKQARMIVYHQQAFCALGLYLQHDGHGWPASPAKALPLFSSLQGSTIWLLSSRLLAADTTCEMMFL